MATVEERLSRLEGGYEHLATRADIADVRAEVADVRAEIAVLRVEIAAVENRLMFRLGGLMVSGFAALSAVIAFVG